MITLDEAKDTIIEARRFALSGAEFLIVLGPSNVARACNGIGPEKMPEKWRKKLDKCMRVFAVPCRVHDCRFTFDNDGTAAKFRAANDELERNCLILANTQGVWYNPKRWWWRHNAKVVAWICQTFGWDSWREAFDKAKAQGIVPCVEQKQFPAGAGNAGGL